MPWVRRRSANHHIGCIQREDDKDPSRSRAEEVSRSTERDVQRQRGTFTTALSNDTLSRLQAWYQEHCNGEWENDRGVSIESTDNPGWWVKIDLSGTELESKSFTEVTRGKTDTHDPEPPWMRCYIGADHVFHGAGDPTTLLEILNTFLDWADE